MTNQSSKKKRGGIRQGSGRKRTGQTICLVLSIDEKERAKEIGASGLVNGIKKLSGYLRMISSYFGIKAARH